MGTFPPASHQRRKPLLSQTAPSVGEAIPSLIQFPDIPEGEMEESKTSSAKRPTPTPPHLDQDENACQEDESQVETQELKEGQGKAAFLAAFLHR